MTSNKTNLYNDLFTEYKILHSNKSAQVAQQEFIAIWNDAKSRYNTKKELHEFATNLLKDYRQQRKLKQDRNITNFFAKKSKLPQVSFCFCMNRIFNNYAILFS